VAPGEYQVAATGGRRRALKLTVRADELPEPVELMLVESGVTGKVVDASTGEPLAGAWVECERVLDASSGNLANLVTSYKAGRPSAADGSFAVTGLEAGRYTMRLSRDGYGTELVPEFTITEGETLAGISVKLGPACMLTGMVKNASGTPVEGASFKVVTESGKSLFLIDMTTSATDGVYSQGSLKPGRYRVTASKDGYAPTTLEVTVRADDPTEADFVLLQGGRVEVTVRSGGDPVRSASLVLLDSGGKPVTKSITLENLFSTRMDTTDSNGQAKISGIPAGTYTVRVKRGTAQATSDSFEVFEATSTAVEVALPQGGE
jgi:5-hydroxyisourate hydrolase-like protein (transthyretin family)